MTDSPIVIRPWPGDSPPWFKLWRDRLLGSSNVQRMDAKTFGAYMFVLLVCWQDGAVDDERDELLAITRLTPADFKKVWPRVRRCLEPTADGRLHSPRMTKEREGTMDASTKQSERAQLRWKREREAKAAELLEAEAGTAESMPPHSSGTAGPEPPGVPEESPADTPAVRLETLDDRNNCARGSSQTPNASGRHGVAQDPPTEPGTSGASTARLTDNQAEALTAAFLALLRQFNPACPNPRDGRWGEPLRAMHDDDGIDVTAITGTAAWLYGGAYKPDRPQFDLRTRTVNPAAYRQQYPTITALMASQRELLDDPAQPACLACERHGKPAVVLAVHTFTCKHKRIWMFLDELTCPHCAVKRLVKRSGGSCLDCDEPPNDDIRAWLRPLLATNTPPDEEDCT